MDVLIQPDGKKIGFEFKVADALRMTKSLSIAQNKLGLYELLVVKPMGNRYPLEEKNCALPLAEKLELLHADSIDGHAACFFPMPLSLPFNKSSLQGRVLEFTFQTITHGQIGVDQTFSKKCHGFLEEDVEVRRALVTTSCTHAYIPAHGDIDFTVPLFDAFMRRAMPLEKGAIES